MSANNRPSLQQPFGGDDDYVVGGYHNNRSNNSGRHWHYNNGGGHPDSPSACSQMTSATRKDQEGEEDPNAPFIISVIAPATLEEGYTIDVMYNDETHTVDIPPGGVKEGEEFETVIDPKRQYQDQYSSRSILQMDQLVEEDEEDIPRRSSPCSRGNSPYSRDNSPYSRDNSPYSRDNSPYSRDNSPYSRGNSPYSRGDQLQQEEQRRQSQRSGNSGQQTDFKLLSAKIYDDGSEYTSDSHDKTKEIEAASTFPAHSLSGDDEDEETMMEKTHIQNQDFIDEDNKADDASGENKDTVWYDNEGIPHGTWRTRLCSCCDVLTQSTFWMGIFCTPVLMAQLVTRLGLTWNGREGPPEQTYLSYNRIVLGLVFVMSIYWIPFVGSVCVFIYYLLVIVYIGSHVRGYMRQKYQIPSTLPTRCGPRIDDFCMMLCCGCCSSIQMVRHTHDDKDYPGHACTTTGLEFDAPSIV